MRFIVTLFFFSLKYLLLHSVLLKCGLISSLPWTLSVLWFPGSLLDKGICIGSTWLGFRSKSWGLCLHPDLCGHLLACRKILGFFLSFFHSFPCFTVQTGSSFSLFCRWFMSGKYWNTLHVFSVSFWSNFKDCKALFLLNCSTGYGNTINIWSAQHHQHEQHVWKAKLCFKQSIW